MVQLTLDDFAPFLLREGISRRKTFSMASLLVNGNVFLFLSPTGVVYKMNESGCKKPWSIWALLWFSHQCRVRPR